MRKSAARWGFYLLGMAVLAAALTLYTKTGLGVSSVLSVPFVISEIWGLDFGNVTFVFYVAFVFIQMILHWWAAGRKWCKQILLDALQLLLSLIFTRVMNLVSALVPLLTGQEGFFGTLIGRLLVLLLAVVLTGIGAAMTMGMRLVPNPSDGMVQTLSDVLRKKTGTVKNCLDVGCVVIALALGLIFTHRVVGIGLGTLIAALGIGRVIALYNRFVGGAVRRMAGLE